MKQKRQRNERLALLHHFLNDELRQGGLAGSPLTGDQDRKSVDLAAAIAHQLVADPLEIGRGIVDELQAVARADWSSHALQRLGGQRLRRALQKSVCGVGYGHGCNNRIEATRL